MRKHRLLACAMALAMALSMIPATALAAEAKTANPRPDPISYANGVTLGKTVTDQSKWSSSKEAQVTLSVTPPSPQKTVAVEFVLDATESLLTDKKTGETLIEKYAGDITKLLTNDNLYVGITVFANQALTVRPMDNKVIDSDSVRNQTVAFAASNIGTNVQSGIRAGLADLANAPADTEKYLVLVTDGGSFFYYNDGKDGSRYNGDTDLIGSYNEAADNPSSVTRTIQALWDDSALADTNFENAILASADAVDVIPKDVNLISFGFPYYKDRADLANLTALARDFVDYAAKKSVYSNFLSNVSDLRIVVPENSVITDVIGYNADKDKGEVYNFDVMTDKEFVLNFNGNEVSGTLDSSNKITFGTYAELEYTPAADGSEQFTLTLNQDLFIGQTLTLSYYVKLNNPNTSTGAHYVDTNVNAKLDVPSTSSSSIKTMAFPEPSLSYTVSGGGGYTPPPLLNTEDHFGYIIGYPVDYYTGEKTNDQTRMPVKPQGQITRAEVATIFFRMLTDEARSEYWSQTSSYTDVESDDWFNNAICTLSNAGIISGYPDGSFRPNGKITRAEFATIASRFFDVEADNQDVFPDISGHWAEQYINEAASAGIVTGYEDGTFRPQKLITRAEAVTMVNRTLGRAPVTDHMLPDMLKWPDNMDTTQWYYAQMQEATNSHEYEMVTAADGTKYETWTKMLPIRDWVQFEKEWSDANSASNPGEVVR